MIVTGTPGGLRAASQRMLPLARRTQPWELAVPRADRARLLSENSLDAIAYFVRGRRSVGAPAARSVLLTMMGEYVIAALDGVWQETLISALGTLDHRTLLLDP